MTRHVEVSNSNSNNNINYRNKKAYDKRVQERAVKMLLKTDFAKGIKTLNAARVEATLRRGYRPTPPTQHSAYREIDRKHEYLPRSSQTNQKIGALYSVLLKYNLEPADPIDFVHQTLIDNLGVPTPVIRKMLTKWRVFETMPDDALSDMLYKTMDNAPYTITNMPTVKMLLDMFKKHRKTPIVTGGTIRSGGKKKVQFLLANLPRNVLRNNVDFNGSLGEFKRKQDRLQYLRTLNTLDIDLRQVILETKTPEELGIILNQIGNEYAKSGVLYQYVPTGNPKMTNFLLQRGMDPNSSRRDLDVILARYIGAYVPVGERSPLRIAIERRNIKDIRLFKKKGIAVTPELRRYLERHFDTGSPMYKLLIPPVRPPRMRKVTLASSFNTIDPVSLTPVPLIQAMIYHGNTRLANTPNSQAEKVRWMFHPNTINGLRHSARHPMTRLPLNHSKATKLLPLLREADKKRYANKYERDLAANQ